MKLPEFVIIGAQRCGTTSLYGALTTHPAILPASMKEVHFFDKRRYASGIEQYAAHFKDKPNTITGEATPIYVFHPLVPERMRKVLPDVKLIVLLRDPIRRAFSHYWHAVRRMGAEKLSFGDAVRAEAERMSGEAEKIIADRRERTFKFRKLSYLSRGIYVDQLDRWTSQYDRRQILILKSEEMFKSPTSSLREILSFLGVEEIDIQFPRKNSQSSSRYEIDQDTMEYLRSYFEQPNERLYRKYGIDFR